jgi:hypothetical protein
MTSGGSHVLFTTLPARKVFQNAAPVQLEPNAPPSPVGAIYDRPLGGPTSVVSLLPENATPMSDAHYLGANADASAVAFEINGTIFVRRGGSTTQAAAYPKVGDQLSCAALGAEEPYRWLRDGTPIAGETTGQYTLQPEDEGHAIQCEATVEGQAAGTSVPPTLVTTTEDPIEPPQPKGPIPAPTPASPTAGTNETCNEGEWSGSPSFSYQWFRSGEEIASANSKAYEVKAADVPSSLQCQISASNGDGTVVTFSAAQQTSPAPAKSSSLPLVDITETALTFSGVSHGGDRVFYSRGRVTGEEAQPSKSLEAFDAETGATTVLANEGHVWPVSISEDGSHAYFISTAVLTGEEANSVGDKAEGGEDNLYVWNGSSIRYVATVVLKDISGGSWLGGLGFWNTGLAERRIARDTARTTPDGSALVFQAHANLLPSYDSQGHWEVFRYEAASGELTCVSCNPEGTPATADAELQTTSPEISERTGVKDFSHIPNITPDGKTVVFNTPERLLSEDEDDFYDVYRWTEGELALVSSGQSNNNDFLYGMSANASDIFFQTYDSLVPQDQDGGATSLYDARIDGGFTPPTKGAVCEAEGCQGPVTPPPALAPAATPTFQGTGNVTEATRKKHRNKKKRHRHAKRHAHKAKGGKR